MEVPLLDLQQLATLRALISQNDLSYKQKEIVTILGGINSILNHYIASGDVNDARISEIIAAISKDTKLKVKAEDDIAENHQISLDPNDSILRSIFPESVSKKVAVLILNKILMVLFITAFISITVINSIEFFVYHSPSYYEMDNTLYISNANFMALSIIIFLRLPMMLYLVGLSLFINVKALKLLSRTFLFWFKLLYFVKWFVLWEILSLSNDADYGTVYTMDKILTTISIVTIIILVTSMDGLYLSVWSKRAILSSALLYFASGLFGFWFDGQLWYHTASVTVAGYELHVLQWLGSVVQTLVIFVARQTVSLWRDPTKSTVIGKATYIRWSG